ncbi:major facilitator superfamily domain-containing protein [Xylariaceae sp. FL0804]|nr:major facilitator superfamily domain-containing protein [Xylariaceae sp. FL0804]
MAPSPDDTPAFPAKQLTILAICRFSEPIAFNSILAYTYVMVQDLHGGDDTDASFYAGLLVSAYAVAEALTAMGWGALSDRYGRKPVVLAGLGGVALSSLVFGLAQRYWVALLARFIGGALNGNVSVMQTMVAEMVKVPEHEPRAYATQPFVWTLGGIIGSAMGGFLAQPATFYPGLFPADGLFGRYPYLLPNLVSVVVIVLAIAQGVLFLEETNPRVLAARSRRAKDKDRDNNKHASGSGSGCGDGDGDGNGVTAGSATGAHDSAVVDDDDDEDGEIADETTPLRGPRARAAPAAVPLLRGGERPAFIEEGLPMPVEPNFDLRRTSFGTVHSIKLHHPPPPPPQTQTQRQGEEDGSSGDGEYRGRVFNFTVIMLIVSLIIVSYHQMAFVTLLPTHLLDRPALPPGRLDLVGGLGYTVHDVGVYLAVNGVLGLFIQGVVFPLLVGRVGVWRAFVGMVVLYPTCYLLPPFLSAAPPQLQSPLVYLALVLQSLYGIVVLPCALILLKDAAPAASVLGRVNGAAMSGCCLARTVGPPLVGVVYAAAGSAAAWFSCAGVAVLGVAQLLWVPRRHVPDLLMSTGAAEALDGPDNTTYGVGSWQVDGSRQTKEKRAG